MSQYIDGFVLAVPTANRESYLQMARISATVVKELGALSVVEAWGDEVPPGQLTSFPLAVQCLPEETVVFSWIVWPDKATRDIGMKRFMDDPRMQPLQQNMPFDGKRMIYGGFELLLSA